MSCMLSKTMSSGDPRLQLEEPAQKVTLRRPHRAGGRREITSRAAAHVQQGVVGAAGGGGGQVGPGQGARVPKVADDKQAGLFPNRKETARRGL